VVLADEQMISGNFNWPMTRKHTHKNTKKAQQKEKGNWEAGRIFFFTFLV
jgi:hypothetical protein